jgi:hypothetical protein
VDLGGLLEDDGKARDVAEQVIQNRVLTSGIMT